MAENPELSEKIAGMMVKFYKSDRRWLTLKRVGLAAAFVISTGFGLFSYVAAHGHWPIWGSYAAVVSIKGVIEDGSLASADKEIPALRKAFNDSDAKVVVLEIDSPGGSPIEAERIYTEMARLKVQHPKPVLAVINTLGASAAYLVAIHADKIVAGQYSQVGSIGAIMSSYNVHKIAERFQIDKLTFASGPLKSMLDPLGVPNDREKVKAQDMVDQAAGLFIAEVKKERGGKLKSNDLYTGETWLGPQALQLGLIDQIGTIESVAEDYKLTPTGVGPASGMYMEGEGGVLDSLGAAIARHILATADQSKLQL